MEASINGHTEFDVTTSLRWRTVLTVGETTEDLPQLDVIPLYFHRDRLLAAAKAFNWPTTIALLSGHTGLSNLSTSLLAFTKKLPSHDGTYKLRLNISPTGKISIDASDPITHDIFPFSLPPWPTLEDPAAPHATVYISSQPTTPSLHTRHKTTLRHPYNQIISSLPSSLQPQPPTTAEIILFNSTNQVTECIYSTPFFKRGSRLITPAAACGGNLGVTRRLALEKGWCEEGIVDRDSLMEDEIVVLSNAVRGFWTARVKLVLPPDDVTAKQ